jgi:glycosyltransferase involved in cell wall biosynthesis
MNSSIALAFVGTVVPDEPQYRSSAFNPAGNNFQYQLIRGLARNGISDIEVFSARPIASFPRSTTAWVASQRERLEPNITLRLLPFPNLTPLKQLVLGLDVLYELLRWGLRKRKAHSRVVFTYNLSVPPGAFTLLGARLVRAKALVSVNDINIPGETVPGSALWRFDLRLQRWLLPMFDGHLVVSDDIAKDFFPGRPYIRVEGGVDTAFLERTRPTGQRPKPRDARFALAFAGWLNEPNGVPLILSAFRMVRSHDFRLRIAGSGPLQAMVEEAAQADPRVEYLGMLDGAGVAALYADSDVLLNIRLTQAVNTRYFFPTKLIEYLASGVPTITTRVGQFEDTFKDLAYLLHDESPSALAELLLFVASRSPTERSNLAARARAYVSTHQTWEIQGAKVADYVRQVLGDTRRTHAAQ